MVKRITTRIQGPGGRFTSRSTTKVPKIQKSPGYDKLLRGKKKRRKVPPILAATMSAKNPPATPLAISAKTAGHTRKDYGLMANDLVWEALALARSNGITDPQSQREVLYKMAQQMPELAQQLAQFESGLIKSAAGLPFFTGDVAGANVDKALPPTPEPGISSAIMDALRTMPERSRISQALRDAFRRHAEANPPVYTKSSPGDVSLGQAIADRVQMSPQIDIPSTKAIDAAAKLQRGMIESMLIPKSELAAHELQKGMIGTMLMPKSEMAAHDIQKGMIDTMLMPKSEMDAFNASREKAAPQSALSLASIKKFLANNYGKLALGGGGLLGLLALAAWLRRRGRRKEEKSASHVRPLLNDRKVAAALDVCTKTAKTLALCHDIGIDQETKIAAVVAAAVPTEELTKFALLLSD